MTVAAWHPRKLPTLWLDVAGKSLADVLWSAREAGAERVMLTGPCPPRSWFLASVDGWEHGAHHLDYETAGLKEPLPVGRYTMPSERHTVTVRRAAEWFGGGEYTPDTARTAWDALEGVLATHVPGASLFATPGATGMNCWLLSRPRSRETGELIDPPQLDPDTADLIRSTSPQHRMQLVTPPSTVGAPTMPALWYLDGRWMYAALLRELGTGPVIRQTGEQCEERWQVKGGPYARARYLVDFAAPVGWEHVSVFMVRASDDPADGWTFPLQGRTWADAAEVELARRMGWSVRLREGLMFTPGRPLDTWAERLTRARDAVSDDTHGPEVARLVRLAVRLVLLYTVGGWHSTGRDELTTTDSQMRPPAGEGWGAPTTDADGRVIWRRRVPLTGRAAALLHPEWSSQVWGRGHVRVLDAPTAERGVRAGALYASPADLVAITGDALTLTRRPHWADLDDGRPGRLRVKGHLCGPIPWPARAGDRDRLARAADAAGPTCQGDCP